MKKNIILLVLMFTSPFIFAKNIESFDNIEMLNKTTSNVCFNIDKESLEISKKMACLNILIKGYKIDNFYSYFVFYNALKSGVNLTTENDINTLYNKMKNLNKNKNEETLFKSIK